MKTFPMLATLTGFALSLCAVRADILYTESGTPANLAAYGDSGVSFQVSSPIEVTELGFFGLSLGGADTPWAQLWNVDTTTQIGVVNWAAGTASAGWNYKALAAPVTLNPGVNYQVQGMAWWVPTYADINNFTAGPAITGMSFHRTGGFAGWTPLAAPSTTADTTSIPSMVNMTYSVIPEPSSLVLLGLGLFAAVGVLRKRK